MHTALLIFADSSGFANGAIIGAVAAFVVLFPLFMTIVHVRLKPGRSVEFSDNTGRVQPGSVVSHSWGSYRVRVRSENGQEYDARLKTIKYR